VPVAHVARDLPRAVLESPDLHEAERAAIRLAVLGVAEAMRADLDRAVVVDRIDLEAALDEVAMDVPVAGEDAGETGSYLLEVQQAAGS
jgi:hypothetical protein